MRLLLRTFAILALFPYLGVVLLLLTGTASWSSVGYVAAAGLLLGGLVTLPDPTPDPFAEEAEKGRKKRRPRGISRAGALAIVAVMSVRTCTADGGRSMSVAKSDGSDVGSSRLVNRLVDEGDLALLGARVAQTSGLYGDDQGEVSPAMRDAYARMRSEQGGGVASPVAATYLGLQSRGAFDVVMIEPLTKSASAPAPAPTSALIFLHGYAGNFEMPCWQMAHAVDGLDMVTACPSTSFVGDWWTPEGEAILNRTVDVLRARGVSRFVLAGLSNGGYGASELAPRMKGTFAGLILISGAQADQPDPGVPVLLVHGAKDNVAPVEEARRYATKHHGKLVEVNAGHFALLVRAEEANRAIHDFVAPLLNGRVRVEPGGRDSSQNGSIRTSTESVSGPPPT